MLKTDIAIIGAGFSGLALAHSLVNSGINIKITLIEKHKAYPSNFRSDKIESAQARIMRELDILKYKRPAAGPIGDILVCGEKSEQVFDTVEQYGIDYTATINNLRAQLPNSIELINATVDEITDSDDAKIISLSNNDNIEAKLAVICTGGNNKLIDRMGIQKYRSDNLKSLTFGFDIKKQDNSDFDFKGLKGITYHNNTCLDGVYYIIIFPIGDRMRCNLFTQMDPKSSAARNLRKRTLETLPRYFPTLYEKIGDVELASTVQLMPTQLYRLKNYYKDRLIILGDELQGVNPATGTGFSKILSEVHLLAKKYIPYWLAKNDFSKNAIAKYYNDKDKLQTDISSIQQWLYFHKKAVHENGIMIKLKQRILSRGYFFMLEHI